MRPEYMTLNDLTSSRLFSIPAYQRAYSWRKRQREELFSDLDKLAQLPEDRHHFMSTIVCFDTGKTENTSDIGRYRWVEVVDGQQRLTTLFLLIRAIGDAIIYRKPKIGNAMTEKLIKAKGELILLQTNHDESDIFGRYVRYGEVPNHDRLTTHSARALSNGINDCIKYARKNVEEYNEIIAWRMLNNLGFVYYEVQEKRLVYSIFELLNSRGLSVDWLDKCKSVLMGGAYEEAESGPIINEIHNKWQGIYKAVGVREVPGISIMQITSTLYYPSQPSQMLKADEAFDFVREQSRKGAEHSRLASQRFLDVTNELVELDKKYYSESVGKINFVRLLWVAIRLSGYNEETVDQAIKEWEKVSFRVYSLCDHDSRTGKGVYARLAYDFFNKQIEENEVVEKVKGLGDRHNLGIDVAVNNNYKVDCYNNWETDLRYLLFEYERYLAKKNNQNIPEEVWNMIWESKASNTIEHILPQDPGEEWQDVVENIESQGEDVDVWINRLGNLTLLPPRMNSQAGSYSFYKKKEIYKKSGLYQVRSISENEKWGYKEIENRENEILEWMRERFV